MSTKPIREALKMMSEHDRDAYAAALEAVRAIEEMARTMLADLKSDRPMGFIRANLEEKLESIAKEAP